MKNVSIEVLFKLQIIFNWESVDELKKYSEQVIAIFCADICNRVKVNK